VADGLEVAGEGVADLAAAAGEDDAEGALRRLGLGLEPGLWQGLW
jgi:hypothetical protein